jgi:4-amino-4-deoxy-L-arabinose transferase-like glycosyltransferase
MSFPFNNRGGHYALLTLVWAVLCLANLGGPSLWDIDEGHNATAALEMYESGNFIVPTFNYALREDKPVLLYWLQVAAYHCCGVNEFAARLPSALAALLTVLLTYELGRRLFDPSTGLLAGLILASAVLFCASAHFANPDALLNLCTVLCLFCFWQHYTRGGLWLVASGAAAGLGMLAKGPVALVLPVAVTFLFLLWRGELRRLRDLRLLGATLAFALVAAPWYVWVGVETKGQWLRGFFLKHNLDRALAPMEHHGGPLFYYLIVLLVGLAPWSVFLGSTCWYVWKQVRSTRTAGPQDSRMVCQFLVCWFAVYFLCFSIVRTKLPNYILPLYPAAAVLGACFLDHWRRGLVTPPAWMMPTSIVSLAIVGVGVSAGLLAVSGLGHVSPLRNRFIPELAPWSSLGMVFLTAAAVAGWCLVRQRRGALLACVALSGIGSTGAVVLWGVDVVDRYKAPRFLTQALPSDHLFREERIAAYDYFQPSLAFYCQREVHFPRLDTLAIDFLRTPVPAYLFVSAEKWEEWGKGPTLLPVPPCHVLARHRDFYNGREVLLVTNR